MSNDHPPENPDLLALRAALHANAPRVLHYLRRKLPTELRRFLEPQDILQDTFFEAFQRVGDFDPEGEDAAYRWLVTIARNRMLNLLRAHRRKKRGSGAKVNEGLGDVLELLEQVLVYSRTPSRSAISHEIVTAVQQSVERLEPHYGTAIKLRYLDGLTIDETATQMGRSPGAVEMLCLRGLKALKLEIRAILTV